MLRRGDGLPAVDEKLVLVGEWTREGSSRCPFTAFLRFIQGTGDDLTVDGEIQWFVDSCRERETEWVRGTYNNTTRLLEFEGYERSGSWPENQPPKKGEIVSGGHCIILDKYRITLEPNFTTFAGSSRTSSGDWGGDFKGRRS
ncbi:hypothetical protein Pelo_7286 [Pelomyxa schiedti]|nr:hypothetical protein Pelo_7286 [Pelomyxa schiedti]